MFTSVNGEELAAVTGPSQLAVGQTKRRDRGQASREIEKADLRAVIESLAMV